MLGQSPQESGTFKSPKINSMTRQKTLGVCLTIAGSDCSGGAGLEADLKTFNTLQSYGMSAATCVVAENPSEVVAIHPIPSRIVRQQISCCLEGMSSVAVKTGMLYSASIIQAVHKELSKNSSAVRSVVIDPVMVATSGKRLLKKDAIHRLKNLIAAHADLVTPNLDEAEILAERTIRTKTQMETAAVDLAKRFDCAVLLKGGHLVKSPWAEDFLWNGKKGEWFRSKRIRNVKTHGTGCTYSAAIIANLSQGRSLFDSVRFAKKYLTRTIQRSHRFKPWMALNHNV
jgi:hydroxymethylpyrimidine/phosphomethylpyrimidine kinase